MGLKKSRFYTATSEKDVKQPKLKKRLRIVQFVRIRETCILKSFMSRVVARTLIEGGGGVFIHIFMFCPTSFFSN